MAAGEVSPVEAEVVEAVDLVDLVVVVLVEEEPADHGNPENKSGVRGRKRIAVLESA